LGAGANCRGTPFPAPPFIGGFIAAFARCCFCIARHSRSLGVFASLWVANPRKGRLRKSSSLHKSHAFLLCKLYQMPRQTSTAANPPQDYHRIYINAVVRVGGRRISTPPPRSALAAKDRDAKCIRERHVARHYWQAARSFVGAT